MTTSKSNAVALDDLPDAELPGAASNDNTPGAGRLRCVGSVFSSIGLGSVAQNFGSLGGTANAVGSLFGGVSSNSNSTANSGSGTLGNLASAGGLAKDAFSLFGGGEGGGIGGFLNNTIGGSLGLATTPTIGSLFPSVAAEALPAYAAANSGILTGASSIAGEGLLGTGLLGATTLSSIIPVVGLAVGALSLSGVLGDPMGTDISSFADGVIVLS